MDRCNTADEDSGRGGSAGTANEVDGQYLLSSP